MKKHCLFLLPLLLFVMQGCKDNKQTYTIEGDITMANTCAGALPPNVKVSVMIYDKNETVGLPGSAQTGNDGKFTITHTRDISTSKEAEHWEFDKITRPDGTEICKHPDMKCAEGQCDNYATNAKNKYKMNEKGAYNISCRCGP